MNGETRQETFFHDIDDPVMISAIEHYSYCPRQYALIHMEQVFDENLFTLRGRAVHELVDEGGSSVEGGIRVERSLPLWSTRLGLVGKADVVEFRNGIPYPVEYKHGPARGREHDLLQVTAQALCLEEMFGLAVPGGAIFHHSSRKRVEVSFTTALRDRVEDMVRLIRILRFSKTLPPPVNDGRCRNCSLKDSCMPSVTGERERLGRLVKTLFVIEDEGDT